jgi:hypothetical protein
VICPKKGQKFLHCAATVKRYGITDFTGFTVSKNSTIRIIRTSVHLSRVDISNLIPEQDHFTLTKVVEVKPITAWSGFLFLIIQIYRSYPDLRIPMDISKQNPQVSADQN